jgi:outer membrane murein-binding lipoprotein Lpp
MSYIYEHEPRVSIPKRWFDAFETDVQKLQAEIDALRAEVAELREEKRALVMNMERLGNSVLHTTRKFGVDL